ESSAINSRATPRKLSTDGESTLSTTPLPTVRRTQDERHQNDRWRRNQEGRRQDQARRRQRGGHRGGADQWSHGRRRGNSDRVGQQDPPGRESPNHPGEEPMKTPGKRQSRTAAADATGLLGLESVMAG